jgi:hypothetical protein
MRGLGRRTSRSNISSPKRSAASSSPSDPMAGNLCGYVVARPEVAAVKDMGLCATPWKDTLPQVPTNRSGQGSILMEGWTSSATSKESYLAEMKAMQDNLRAGMYTAAAGRATKVPGHPKSTKTSSEVEVKPAAFEGRKAHSLSP